MIEGVLSMIGVKDIRLRAFALKFIGYLRKIINNISTKQPYLKNKLIIQKKEYHLDYFWYYL